MDHSPFVLSIRRVLSAWPLVALGLVFMVRPPVAAPESNAGVHGAAMRLAIDPATGDPIGMPAGGVDLDALLDRSSAGLVQYRLPNGGYGMDLNGRFSHALVIHRRPDGTFTSDCTHDGTPRAESVPTDPSTWAVR